MVSAFQAFKERGEERIFTFAEIEFFFGNQTVVDVCVRQRGIRSDEPAVTPHHMDQPHAVHGAFGFIVSGSDHVVRGIDSRFKTEGAVHETDVVIDRLRNTDDTDIEAAALGGFRQFMCAAERAVAPHTEEHIDIQTHERFQHYIRILCATGGPENGAALLVDVIDRSFIQHHRGITAGGIQTGITVRDPVNQRHAVGLFQGHGQAFDHAVETGAETTGSEDRGFAPAGIMKNLFPGTGFLKNGDLAGLLEVSGKFGEMFIHQHQPLI